MKPMNTMTKLGLLAIGVVITASPMSLALADTNRAKSAPDSAERGVHDTRRVFGGSGAMGQGKARTYAELNADGSPASIGIVYTRGVLEGLPKAANLKSRCFDVNGNGTTQVDECIGDHELVLSSPPEVINNADIPIKWATLNWNPHGHPPAIWKAPHFDFHFYLATREDIQAIRPGPCGEIIDCEDFKRATKPLPPRYLPVNYKSVDAAVATMGNHLIDSASPEMADPSKGKFTHSFIYGAYDGHIVFYEPMAAHDFLLSRPNECKTFSLPAAWERSGYYPTEYCIRYRPDNQETTVSLEKFVYREAR